MRENPMLWDMHSSHSLLPQPISELRRSLEMKKAIQADVEQLDSSFIASDSSLWVDKYAPQRFRELLSNEVSSTLAQKTIQLSLTCMAANQSRCVAMDQKMGRTRFP